MGVKSRTRAENRKESKKKLAIARLNNIPTSPRKMRIVADLIRGKRVESALHVLKTNAKQPASSLHKLLLSAISNWQAKNEGIRIEESDLYIKEIQVDGGRILKRIQPAPQGRAHRIRKRSNHVTIILDNHYKPEQVKADVSREVRPEEDVKKTARPVKKAKTVAKPKVSTPKPVSAKGKKGTKTKTKNKKD